MKRNYCKTTMLPFCMALLLSVFTLQSGYAQQKEITVSGKITSTDDKMGIPGANIVVEGSNASTTADFDGNYKINVNTGDVLKFSYVGFKTQSITVTNQSTINVALATESSTLEEVDYNQGDRKLYGNR